MSRRTGKSEFNGNGGGRGPIRPGSLNAGYRAPNNMQVDDNGPTGGSSNVSTLLDRCRREDALDGEFGFVRINDSPVDQNRLGWLYNAHPVCDYHGLCRLNYANLDC